MPGLPSLTAEHVREFLGSLYARGNKPATVRSRYGGLNRFFRWLREEGEVVENPLDRIKPPQVPAQVLPHYEAREVEAMLQIWLYTYPVSLAEEELIGPFRFFLMLSFSSLLIRALPSQPAIRHPDPYCFVMNITPVAPDYQ